MAIRGRGYSRLKDLDMMGYFSHTSCNESLRLEQSPYKSNFYFSICAHTAGEETSVAHPSQFGSDSDPACEHRFGSGFGFGSYLNEIYHQFFQPLSVNTFMYEILSVETDL